MKKQQRRNYLFSSPTIISGRRSSRDSRIIIAPRPPIPTSLEILRVCKYLSTTTTTDKGGGGKKEKEEREDTGPGLEHPKDVEKCTTTLSPPSSNMDVCDLHIISSPYPPIENYHNIPVPEFVMKNWGTSTSTSTSNDDRIAIIDGSTGLSNTFNDYKRITINLASSLHYDLGIDETTTCSIICPNHINYLPICLAVSLCGSKLSPINPVYTSNELSVIIERSNTTILFTHISTLDVAMDAVYKNKNQIKHIIVITDDDKNSIGQTSIPHGTINLNSLITKIPPKDKTLDKTIQILHNDTSNHACLLPYSSGTTGLPKGVCLSHTNIVANIKQCDEVEGISITPGTTCIISPLPFFHIYGYLVTMIYNAWKGCTVITNSQRFDLELFCSLVEKYQPSRAHLVPPIMVGLNKHPIIDNYDLSSIQMILSAAAPLSKEVENGVKKRLPNIEIKQAWGMSELSPIATMPTDYNYKSGSIGPLVSNTYGKIINPETGKTLAANKTGELCIKGPQVMMGYLNDPEKTSECLSGDGWLHTGDLAHYDNDNFFYITDRLKELIKVRGYQVAPAELEALLLTHDDITDVAVIQVEDEKSGELPRAYIVLKEKENDNNDKDKKKNEIYEWVKERVAPYKRLDGGIIFIDIIPKSASGKILRRILRDEVKKEKEKMKKNSKLKNEE